MINLVENQVTHFLNDKRVIGAALLLLAKRAAVIENDRHFIGEIDSYYPPTIIWHTEEPDFVEEGTVVVRYERFRYGSDDFKIFIIPISALWEIEKWEEDLINRYDQIVIDEQRKAQEKAEAELGTQEARERETLARLKEKYPE